MTVKRYRKKPVVIEAMRIEPDSRWSDITEFSPSASIIYPNPNMGGEPHSYVEIETLEGTMRANGGDWIIKGVKGEFYACKPDVFELTYEEVRGRCAGRILKAGPTNRILEKNGRSTDGGDSPDLRPSMKPYWDNGVSALYDADAREIPLPDGSVHCVVTSPPYWGMRDYGLGQWDGGDAECEHAQRLQETTTGTLDGGVGSSDHRFEGWSSGICGRCGAVQESVGIGAETTLGEHIQNLVAVFREIRRVLRDDGTAWLNYGDIYVRQGGEQGGGNRELLHLEGIQKRMCKIPKGLGLVPKNIIGMPGEIARALRMPYLRCLGCDQVDHETAWGYWPDRTPICPGCWKSEGQIVETPGWIVRSPIVWHKLNSMPESATDRPTSAYEMIFMLTKQGRYFYDGEPLRTPYSEASVNDKRDNKNGQRRQRDFTGAVDNGGTNLGGNRRGGANARNVWAFATQPRPDAHFATFPDELPRRCILAGTSERGICPECGAPWVRQVKQTGHVNKREPAHALNHSFTKTDSTGWQPTSVATDSWRPTCDHDADTEPATVLDPFVGSGTTAAVAQALGRRGVGLDLNLEYLDIAAKRIGRVPLPMVMR